MSDAMAEDVLLACPFCGGAPTLVYAEVEDWNAAPQRFWSVGCKPPCDNRGICSYASVGRTISSWNRRDGKWIPVVNEPIEPRSISGLVMVPDLFPGTMRIADLRITGECRGAFLSIPEMSEIRKEARERFFDRPYSEWLELPK